MQPSTREPPVSPWIVIVVGILAVSTASIFIRYAQAYADSLVIAAYRLSIASFVLIPFAIRKRSEYKMLNKREYLLAFLSGTLLAIHFAAWITSLAYTSVASSVVLVTTTPLFVALFSPFTLKEPLARLVTAGLVLASIGGVLVGLSDTCALQGFQMSCPPLADFVRGQAFLGDLLALAGAIAAAGYVIIGRNLRAKLSLTSYVFSVYGIAALVLILWMLAAGHIPFGYPLTAYGWFILLALVPQLVGHSSFNWALGYLSAAFVSITLLGEPVGSTILAYFLLDERPTILKIFGAILILAGILVAARSEKVPKT
jgi:drug/metabolite transporter (DMT)-like permease